MSAAGLRGGQLAAYRVFTSAVTASAPSVAALVGTVGPGPRVDRGLRRGPWLDVPSDG